MGYRSFVVHKERVKRIVAQTHLLGSSVVMQTRKVADKALATWLLSGGVSCLLHLPSGWAAGHVQTAIRKFPRQVIKYLYPCYKSAREKDAREVLLGL